MQVWPGKPFPLGATFDGSGTTFIAEQENGPVLDAGARIQVQPWGLLLLRRLSPK